MNKSCIFAVAWALAAVVSDATGAEPDRPPVVTLPGGLELKEVDFTRHVLPLISRLGCNAAACHGSFQGRGGFRLSLFEHDPDGDLEALEVRVDVATPKDSLILTKPTLLDDHEGGKLFELGSWEYEILHTWIQNGARYDPLEAMPSVQLTAEPPALTFAATGETQSLRIKAIRADLPAEDVTAFCRFQSHEPAVADVTATGTVRAVRPGATHVLVSYAGEFVAIPVTVPFSKEIASVSEMSASAEENLIDREIHKRLEQISLAPAEKASDATFLRRATLDTLGRFPTLSEISSFLADTNPLKRDQLIDRLLEDPQHASVWATRLCDLTGCRLETMEGPDRLKQARAQMWHAWFHKRLLDNVPFDEIARGLIVGSSRENESVATYVDREIALIQEAEQGKPNGYADRPSLDLYWRRQSEDGLYPREELAERIAATFLGIQLNCARCHKHPHDRWTQHDYQSFVGLFDSVSFGSSIELNAEVFARLEAQRQHRAAGKSPQPLPRIQEVFDRASVATKPRDHLAILDLLWDSNAPREHEVPRQAFAHWLTQPGNPYFARNWVNRIWAHYFGRGLVEPVDGFSASNPATHPELLDRLSREFADSGYDMRSIERLILKSETYQRSTAHTSGTRESAKYYASTSIRPLPAETMVQVLDQALGHAARWKDESQSGSVWDIGADRPKNERLAYLLDLFGRATRSSICDCDRSLEPTLRQTLHLMSDAKWLQEVRDSSLLKELTTNSQPTEEALTQLFLRTLSRLPTSAERATFLEALESSKDPTVTWTDAIWAILNSQAFRTNH